MEDIYKHFEEGFEKALRQRIGAGRRIGAELKFPLVAPDGAAVDYPVVERLWKYLIGRGWRPLEDRAGGKIVGAAAPGEQNETVASCETGYCKTEFSLAHVADIHRLVAAIEELVDVLKGFAEEEEVHFLGYGIQPLTPPGKDLLMRKSRTSVWDRVFASNEHIPEEHGDDFHLFTVNSASHVHISVARDEAVPLVNVLNGFCPAQVALTAHSNVWRGSLDPDYKCVAEKFWDWWMPEEGRVGMPLNPFKNLRDYVKTTSDFRPVYVRRGGKPVLLPDYDSFAEYYRQTGAAGYFIDGSRAEVTPGRKDIDLHATCYWYNARLSRYYTVENRLNDQQPPDELHTIAALTLGLAEMMHEALFAVKQHQWDMLRDAREQACRLAAEGEVRDFKLSEYAGRMLEIAEKGLERRGLGEEKFLAPLQERQKKRRCPADEVEEIFKQDGVRGIVQARCLHSGHH